MTTDRPLPADAPRSGRRPRRAGAQPVGNVDATASIGDAAATVPTARQTPRSLDDSTGDLLRRLTENVQSLVQGEVASARQEMTGQGARPPTGRRDARRRGRPRRLAAGTSAVVLVRLLDRFLPPTTSAAVATALLGGGAAVLAKAGAEQVRLVGPPVPERTLESVKADVAAVTEATPG